MNRRSTQQNRAVHAVFTAFARHFPGTTADDWKRELVARFPQFLAEAEGRRILPRRAVRESTANMDTDRCSNLIECCMWIGAELGVQFRNDD